MSEEQVVNPIEDKAKTQGWVPKEDFRGDPAKWVDAETFVKRGEDILPVLKERNDHLVKEIQGMKEDFKKFAEYSQKAEERAYQKALNEIKERELKAVAEQDLDGFQVAQKEREELEKAKPVPPVTTPATNPIFEAFKAKNKWYDTDSALAAEADAMGAALSTRGMAYPNILAEVEKTMRVLHPDKFENSRRDNPPAVEFQNDTGLPKKKAEKTYENLPAEAKAACEKFISRGWVKSKEEYLANYEWE